MTTILFIVQFVLVFIICVAVLMQKSSSIGLGAYSGSNESLFGAKGPMGFLAKFTFVVGLLLIINTIALGYLYNTRINADSVAERASTIVPNVNQEQNSSQVVPQQIQTTPNAEQNNTN